MKRRLFWVIVITIGALLISKISSAQVTSDFEVDMEGWTFTDINMGTPQTVNHSSSGGNPGGKISSTLNNSGYRYFDSPAKFNGNIAYLTYGEELSFDLQVPSGTPSVHSSNGDVTIRYGSGSELCYTLPTFPAVAPGWTSYTVRLDETTDWRVNIANGTVATKAQIKSALASVIALRINGRYVSGFPIASASLDNVRVTKRVPLQAPSLASFSAMKGKGGETISINGTNFGSTAANNAVYFNGLKATISDASPTQLTVVVPSSAPYGPVTVTNTTTGLSARSASSFNPTFNNGGRIIASTFKPKTDILLEAVSGNDLMGHALADLDGDGWLDIVFGESQINSMSIMRNKGEGGTLSLASFESKLLIPGAGNQPGVAVIDIDGDGKLDIIGGFANASSTFFATLRNTSTPGNISFEPVEVWAGNAYSGAFANLIDLDGDGLVDLIGQHGNGSVNVDLWISQNISEPGNIEFLASTSYFGGATLDAGDGVSAGDLDNDGKPELLVRYSFGGAIAILRNTSVPGTISFETPVPLGTGSSGSMRIIDLNLDGLRDLVLKKGFSNDDVVVRLNTHSGTGAFLAADFATEFVFNSNMYNYGSVAENDINGDGRPDIMVTDSRHIGVFENVFNGGAFDGKSFVDSYANLGGGISTYMSTPLAADLNGDQRPDIVVGITNLNPPRLAIYENTNTMAPEISVNTISPLQGAVGSTVTITGNNFSTTPAENFVKFGSIPATVLTATTTELTVEVPAGAPYAPISVTRDNLTSTYDLPFTVTFGPGTVFDNTMFSAPAVVTLSGANYDVEIGDIDGDGLPDIAAEGTGTNGYTFRNVHSSGPITSASFVAGPITNSSAANLKLVDINDDGKPDLIANNGSYRNVSTSGTIAFDNLISAASGSDNLSTGDFNKDGKRDVVGTEGSANVAFYESWIRPGVFVQTGDYGSFSANINVPKAGANGGTAVADFDRDGKLDVASSNPTTDNITILRNTGAFRIEAAQFTGTNFASLDNPGRIYTGDIDVDGKSDLMVYYNAGTSSAMVSVFHNQSTVGNIMFTRADYAIPTNGTTAAIGDLDGDGRPELVVISEAGDRFFILKNTSTPGTINASSFAAPFTTTATNPRGVAIADLNFDGKSEIIISAAPSSLLFYENLVPIGPTITIDTQPSFTYACEGSSATFTVAASGTTNITYRWQKFDGSVFVDLSDAAGYSGTATSTLTINTATTGFSGNGDYRCRINGDLASEVFSDDANLTINSIPSPPDVTGGTECVSPATVTLIATGASDGDYNWYDVPTGGSVLGTNGTFVTPSITTTTTYFVSISDTFCESARVSVDATITLLPAQVIASSETIVGGNLDICEGEDITLTVLGVFTNYLWSNGATTPEITVNAPGSFTVVVEDNSGCTSPPSEPVTVAVNDFPVANISANGSSLAASSGDSYQWFQSGVAIPGATQQTYQFNVLEYGVYSVEVTENGCSTTSIDFVYLITGNEVLMGSLKLYPNPVKENLSIESHDDVTLELFDIAGKKLSSTNVNAQVGKTLPMSDLAAGVYILKMQSSNSKTFIRIVKE